MTHRKDSRWIATAMAIAIVLAPIPAAAATAPGTLSGHIVAADSKAPLAGARLHVGDPRSNAVRSSAPTGADGRFEVAGLPAAAYEIAVESRGGLYVVDSPLRLEPGEHRTVQLAIASGQEAPTAPPGSAPKKTAATFWNNPLTATLVVVGAAVIVGVIVEQTTSNDTTSPSNP